MLSNETAIERHHIAGRIMFNECAQLIRLVNTIMCLVFRDTYIDRQTHSVFVWFFFFFLNFKRIECIVWNQHESDKVYRANKSNAMKTESEREMFETVWLSGRDATQRTHKYSRYSTNRKNKIKDNLKWRLDFMAFAMCMQWMRYIATPTYPGTTYVDIHFYLFDIKLHANENFKFYFSVHSNEIVSFGI